MMACLETGNKEVGREARLCRYARQGSWGTYQSEARVEALSEDGVARFEDKLGEQDLVASLVDLMG